jgi:subtilisin
LPVDKVPVIVGFKGLPDAALVNAFGGDITYEYSIIPAIACSMSPHAIEALKNNPNVEYVQYEVEYQATEYNSGGVDEDWGVTKINADDIHPINRGTGVKVAVVDTGINRLHVDLKANFRGGWDFVNNDNDPNDDNGHGSHCAGIIAAAKNVDAVVGVAPDVSIYAYKALNSRGSGYTSWITAGINRAVTDGCQIISQA